MAKYIHRRNIRFKNYIANADKSKILGVAIDPSSNFHRVIIFNFLGEIILEPFSIDTLMTGYDLLVKNISRAKRKRSATDIYIAIESGGYSENLYFHLYSEYKKVYLISPLTVSQNRKQKSLHGLKTDDIDCGAIGDLLIRGEYTKSVPDNFTYYKLRNLVYWRDKKIKLLVMLKNQIGHRIQRCYPGLNCDFENNKKLYSTSDNSLLYQGLMNNCFSVRKALAHTDDELMEKFNYRRCFSIRINEFKNRLKEIMLPDENHARVHLELLSKDVEILRLIEKDIQWVNDEIVNLGKRTSAIYITGQIKGINALYASMYVGLIGDFKKYKSARNIYSFSGMSPKIQQSGSRSMSHSSGIKRAGNRILRSLLFNMARFAILNDPYFKNYFKKVQAEKKRNWKKNMIAACRKLNNVMFALMRDRSEYKGKALGCSKSKPGLESENFCELLQITK